MKESINKLNPMKTQDVVITILTVIGLAVFGRWAIRFLVDWLRWDVVPVLVPTLVVGGIVWFVFFRKN